MNYFFSILMVSFFITCVIDSNKSAHPIDKELMDLEYLVRQQQDTTKQAPVLILLHGYGSNEKDLFSFAEKIPDNWLVVSVRAPIILGNNKFKWYHVELVNEKITMNFEDEEKSRKSLLRLIDQIISKYNVDKNKVVTAGFSQGANMALGLALTAPRKILAAGCFSGRFMEEIKPLISNEEALKSKQVFISHGTEDQMLPIKYAEENQQILKNWGINITLSTDKVAHSISEKQLNDFVKWISVL